MAIFPIVTVADEVVVTAGRVATGTQDVAGSISRLDANALAILGAHHQADALNQVAGVEIQRGSGAESLTAIRSPVLTGPGSCGAFLFLEDSIPIRPVGFCNVNGLFELNYEQASAIEVLRGPGPISYGANAVHGIVNVLSPRPRELPAAAAGLQTGADNFRRLTTALSTRTGVTSLGMYGVATHDGGFRADSGLDEAKLNLALERPLASGTLTVRAAGTVLNQETAGFIRGRDSYLDRAVARANPNPEAFRDAWSSRFSIAYARESCPQCRDFVYFAARRSWMEFSQHFLLGKPIEINEQSSLAAGASTSRALRERLTWTAAVDIDWADAALVQNQPGPAIDGTPAARAIRPAGLQYDYQVAALTTGAALSLDWQATPALRLSTGIRADDTRYDYDNRMLAGNTDENGFSCGVSGCLYSRPADRRDSFANWSPKFEALWRWTPRTSVYALANRGFRPPEMTELYRLQRQQNIAQLDSERLDSLELGVKHAIERGSLRLAVYQMRKRNVILRDADGFNISAGKTRHRGLEYEWRWQPTDALTLSAAGTFAHHDYAFTRLIEAGETIEAGNEIDSAPRHIHALSIDWQPRDALQLALNVRFLGQYYLDAANTATYPGHTVIGTSVGWRLDKDWRLQVRVENLLDRDYADRADFAFGDYRYFPARGRSAFLSVDYAKQ